jgi:hypothetical protein
LPTPEHLRAPFIDWVLSLIAPGAVLDFRLILTIRSDYFNLCSTHPALFDLLKQDDVTFRLKQITDEGLAKAVRKPLLMAGHKDTAEQDALIAQIRRDVSDRPGDLALVQMALFETWKQRKVNGSGLLEAYTAVGGVSGALAHAAEDVRTNKLSPKQQDLLVPIFVRLVNLGDAAGRHGASLGLMSSTSLAGNSSNYFLRRNTHACFCLALRPLIFATNS